jgi:hypothetical protein
MWFTSSRRTGSLFALAGVVSAAALIAAAPTATRLSGASEVKA